MTLRKNVLLVEDNGSTVEVVVMELEAIGYNVTVARDGMQAIEKVVAQPPDLILMDIQLPKMNGLETVRRIREIHATRNIPILAATGKALHEDRESCLAAGCDDYIAKPFSHRELKIVLDRLLASRSRDS